MAKGSVYLTLIWLTAWVGLAQVRTSDKTSAGSPRSNLVNPMVKKPGAPNVAASLAPRAVLTPTPLPSGVMGAEAGAIPRPLPTAGPKPGISPTPTPTIPSGTARPQQPKSPKKTIKAPRKTPANAAQTAKFKQKIASRIGGFGGLIAGRIFGFGLEAMYPVDFLRVGGGFWLGQTQQKAEFQNPVDYRVESGEFAVRSLNTWAEYDLMAPWISLRAGLGYRLISWKFAVSGAGSSANAVLDANSLCLLGSIGGSYPVGNAWLLTYEVAGFSYPLSSKATRTVSASGAFAADIDNLNDNIQELTEGLAKAVSVHSLLLGFAWLM